MKVISRKKPSERFLLRNIFFKRVKNHSVKGTNINNGCKFISIHISRNIGKQKLKANIFSGVREHDLLIGNCLFFFVERKILKKDSMGMASIISPPFLKRIVEPSSPCTKAYVSEKSSSSSFLGSFAEL
jgi:hypothetical protein